MKGLSMLFGQPHEIVVYEIVGYGIKRAIGILFTIKKPAPYKWNGHIIYNKGLNSIF
jgi:hypothetical protein